MRRRGDELRPGQSGSADFGGTVGSIPAYGASFARWGDTANPTGWSAPRPVLNEATSNAVCGPRVLTTP